MDRKAAKELLHIQGWLDRVDEILAKGKDTYLADALLQEAGDSLMMKLGEAAGRLAKLDVLPPDGVRWATAIANRNFLIHQYDEIDREITWALLDPTPRPQHDHSHPILTVRGTGATSHGLCCGRVELGRPGATQERRRDVLRGGSSRALGHRLQAWR